MNECAISIRDEKFDRDEVIEFLAKTYGPNYFDAREAHAFVIENEPSTRPENFILARAAQGKLVGMIRIVERVLSLGSSELKAGVVSSVAVLPDWRGKGIMSRLMDRSIETMRSRGMELSILYGRRAVDGLYPRFGYYGVGRYLDLEIVSCPSFFLSSVSTPTVTPFHEENLDRVMQLYYDTYHPLAGSSVRDVRIWHFLLNRVARLDEATRVFTCKEEGSDDVSGYFVFMGDTLVEAAAPPRVFPAIPELLKMHGIRHIALHPRHPLSCFLRTHCNTLSKERSALDGGYMARIIDLEALMKKMSTCLTLRARQIGVGGECVRLFGYAVNLRDGTIEKTDAPNDIQFKNTATTVLLALGVVALEDIPEIRMTTAKPWLRYLFPETGFHTSAWDEV